jgi:predicted ferric reductase
MVVKALGDFTTHVQSLKSDRRVLVEGPYGGFVSDDSPNHRQVWIAGGIGITPFLSMVRSMEHHEREIDLYYCTEVAEEAYFLDELFAIADEHPRLRVVPIRERDLGFITASDVEAASHVRDEKEIYICGPPAMIRALGREFRALGVKRRRIHFEDFSFL